MTGISLHKNATGQLNWALYWHDYWQHRARPGGVLDEAFPLGNRRNGVDLQATVMPGARSGDWQRGRDQGTVPASARLSRAYIDATGKYSADNGVRPEDIDTINGNLAQYLGEPDNDDGTRAAVQWPDRGAAHDRELA
jgi:hypothetical protein